MTLDDALWTAFCFAWAIGGITILSLLIFLFLYLAASTIKFILSLTGKKNAR